MGRNRSPTTWFVELAVCDGDSTMAQAASKATEKALQVLGSPEGVSYARDNLSRLTNCGVTRPDEMQLAQQHVKLEVVEKGTRVRYPIAYLYCERVVNAQTEKFRLFSGKVFLAVEVRVSRDRIEHLNAEIQRGVEAVTWVLGQNRGDWGEGFLYCGGYEIQFSPVRPGGLNYVQEAKVTFALDWSTD